MKSPDQLTNNFLSRFKELGSFLETAEVDIEQFNIFPPVSQDEIDEVENQFDPKLDETFLAYFRE